MNLLSVNVGQARTHSTGRGVEITGIYKAPMPGQVGILRLGVVGDFIGDAKNHGGPDQAVFIYCEPDYAWWSRQLGRPLEPGTFGENLTVGGLESAHLTIGDRLEMGTVVLEATAPRTPCMTLARRMGDPMFVKRYRRAERPGVYCRVIQEGVVRAGDLVRVVRYGGTAVGIIDVFREHYALERDAQTLQRFLDAPLAVRARVTIEKHLRRLQENG